jgi:hypothetical protein
MKVTQMRNGKGNTVKNQFILSTSGQDEGETEFFQSYDSIIAKREYIDGEYIVTLDPVYWNYSRTTSKYRCIFLREDTQTTKKKIESCEYALQNLN